MKPLPKKFKQYFWDTPIQQLTSKNKEQIINRLLEYGDEQAYSWCIQNFKQPEIIETIRKSRNLSKKTANFLALIFNIPKNQILCLNKSYLKTHKKLWPY